MMRLESRLLWMIVAAAPMSIGLSQAAPATVTGTWVGLYQPPAMLMPLVVKISHTAQGFAAETQSPNQSLLFSSADSVSVEKNKVSIVQSRFNALLSGEISGNTWNGTLSQQGNNSKLSLVHLLPGASCQNADPVLGEWRGTMEIRPVPIQLVLSISGNGANLGATLQTPSVNPAAFPVDAISYHEGSLTFHQSMSGVDFKGTLDGTTLTGTLTQNGYSQTLLLQHQVQ